VASGDAGRELPAEARDQPAGDAIDEGDLDATVELAVVFHASIDGPVEEARTVRARG
jgi:hypothetical protein